MKKYLVILLILLPLIVWAYDSFCDGYELGYQNGHCYGETFCIPPLAPLCPLPHLGEDGYTDGYNRGFIDGLNSK